MLREVREETGLDADVGETARVYSAHLPGVWRDGRRVDAHALRIVYDGWVPRMRRSPGWSRWTARPSEAAWHPVADVVDGTRAGGAAGAARRWPTTARSASSGSAAYALIRRRRAGGSDVLLVQFSARGYHTGSWSLPGGGVGHGESPRPALEREVREECGVACAVGELLAVHDEALQRHRALRSLRGLPRACYLIFAATVDPDAEPRVVEVGGTTEAAAWVPVADVEGRDVRCSTWSATRSTQRAGWAPIRREEPTMSETVFTYGAPALKFGPGASAEIGYDLLQAGARRVLLVTDPGVAATGHPARIAEQMAEPRASR